MKTVIGGDHYHRLARSGLSMAFGNSSPTAAAEHPLTKQPAYAGAGRRPPRLRAHGRAAGGLQITGIDDLSERFHLLASAQGLRGASVTSPVGRHESLASVPIATMF
jgi:hypothetical protein